MPVTGAALVIFVWRSGVKVEKGSESESDGRGRRVYRSLKLNRALKCIFVICFDLALSDPKSIKLKYHKI